MALRRIAMTQPRRELANVTAALEHALTRERSAGPDRTFDPGALAAQVRVAVLRARAAQLRRLVSNGDDRAWRPEATVGVLPFPPSATGERRR